jgi:hypothetical protein
MAEVGPLIASPEHILGRQDHVDTGSGQMGRDAGARKARADHQHVASGLRRSHLSV